MSNRFARCLVCQGFLEHSYQTSQGIDVYRCTRDWADERLFVSTGVGLVEVKATHEGGAWGYIPVDHEKQRLQNETKRINRELEERMRVAARTLNLIDN